MYNAFKGPNINNNLSLLLFKPYVHDNKKSFQNKIEMSTV